MIRHECAETGFPTPPSESSTEFQRAEYDEITALIERTVVWAFGHALVQSEVTLFYKTRMMLPHMRLSESALRMHLERLEAKGYLMKCRFQKVTCWRRLVESVDSADESASW